METALGGYLHKELQSTKEPKNEEVLNLLNAT